jgi:hypothetical protein
VEHSFLWFAAGWHFSRAVGESLAVTQATNANACSRGSASETEPHRKSGLAVDQRTTSKWFNTGAFTAAPELTLGILRAIGRSARLSIRWIDVGQDVSIDRTRQS